MGDSIFRVKSKGPKVNCLYASTLFGPHSPLSLYKYPSLALPLAKLRTFILRSLKIPNFSYGLKTLPCFPPVFWWWEVQEDLRRECQVRNWRGFWGNKEADFTLSEDVLSCSSVLMTKRTLCVFRSVYGIWRDSDVSGVATTTLVGVRKEAVGAVIFSL